jgi:hypothetical protein
VSEYNSDFENAFAAIADAKDERDAIFEWLEEQHPHEMKRLRELEDEIPALRDSLKEKIREHGRSGTYMDYRFTVQKKTKVVVDTGELLERAQERGEIGLLVEAGVLTYSANAHQIERLDGELQAVYSGFVEKKAMTAAVTLPKALKD